MRSSDENNIKKLEEKYQRKLDAAAKGTVTIKEVVAVQVNDLSPKAYPQGEYDKSRVSNPLFYHDQVKDEKEFDLINRMALYIDQLASEAAKIHIADNFKDTKDYISSYDLDIRAFTETIMTNPKPTDADLDKAIETILEKNPSKHTMDEKKQNNITRLSLHEFSLYPSKERGPLTIAGFSRLIDKIERVARRQPENLHLILASVPVVTADNQIQNIVLYVECGPNPIIRHFTKALPSSLDPFYEKTSNPSFSSSIPEQKYVKALRTKKYELLTELESTNVTKEKVEEFEKFCTQHVHLRPPIDLLHTLSDIKDKVENDLYHQPDIDGKQMAMDDSITLMKEIDTYFFECERKLEDSYKYIRPAFHGSKEDVEKGKAINTNISGNIVLKTKGGLLFHTAIDICLDHIYKISLEIIKNAINLATRKGDSTIIPRHASHVVTSSTINLDSSNRTSDTLTQADPDHSIFSSLTDRYIADRSPPIKKIDITSSHFGSHTILFAYRERPLSKHTPELEEVIKVHNRFIVRLEALRQYRSQKLELNDDISNEIKKHILESFIAELEKIKSDPSIIARHRDLIDQYQKEFNQHVIDPSKYYHDTNIKLALMEGEAANLKKEFIELRQAIEKVQTLYEQEDEHKKAFKKRIESAKYKSREEILDEKIKAKSKQAEDKRPSSQTPALHLFRKKLTTKTSIKTLMDIYATANDDIKSDINSIINSILHRQITKQLTNYISALMKEKDSALDDLKMKIETAITRIDSSKDNAIHFRKNTLDELKHLHSFMIKSNSKEFADPLERWSKIFQETIHIPATDEIDAVKSPEIMKIVERRNQTLSELFKTENALTVLCKQEEKAESTESKKNQQERHQQIRLMEVTHDNCIERLSDIVKHINKSTAMKSEPQKTTKSHDEAISNEPATSSKRGGKKH